ncbi:sugar ABC transporter ATP-binding protein [Brachybacterium conglomeratum]|uniref:sugar ABC transporter ATP-binding protein n=1 Tax=Brachybacterium conglomeratum TaxID=47846 RepID=UPI003DA1A234
MDSADSPLLEVRDISKTFPGVRALRGVSLELHAGEVLAVCGENGAGKSTLMNILSGIMPPDDGGRITFRGSPWAPRTPRDAKDSGLVIVHQELQLVPDLDVAQNIALGRDAGKGPRLLVNDRRRRRECAELLDRLGIQIPVGARLGDLSVAEQQMVEIARALSYDAKALIMDEPTAALSQQEAEKLFELVEQLTAEGLGVIYISHRLNEVMQLADRVTVLRDGESVFTADRAEVTRPLLIEKMVGRPIEEDRRITSEPSRDVALEVAHLSTKALLDDVSFTLHRGEILGLAGLMGSGRTELARAIIGADPRSAGTLTIDGRPASVRTPSDAVARGLGYLSEDRKGSGLLLEKSVSDNIAIANLPRNTRFGVVDGSSLDTIADRHVRSLSIRTPSIHQTVRLLSGGNQQKVIIGRWLERDSDILIVDEPTRGIDVGAKEEIYAILEELAEAGKSIIVISSEIPEILRISHRIAVMSEGRLAGIVDRADATQDALMALATAGRDSALEGVE